MAGRLSNAQNASTKSPGRLSTQSEVATSTVGRLSRTASPATTSQPVIKTEEETKEPAKKTGLFSRLGQAVTKTADKTGNALGNTVGRALVENTVKVGQNTGQTLASVSPDVEKMRESQRRLDDSQIKLLKMINENNKKGKDSSRLIKQFNSNTENVRKEGEILPVLDKTNLQVIADWAGLGLDIATAGTVSAGGKQLVKEGIKQTVKQSGKRLAAEGAIIGTAYGTTGAMQEGETDPGRIALSGAIGGTVGAAIPSAIAGVGRLAGKLAPKAAKEVSEGAAKIAVKETAPIEQKIAKETNLLDNIPGKGITDQNGAVLSQIQADKSIANSTPTIKRSGFSERIADSPVTAPEVQKGLKANPKTYEVARNPETVAKARSIIEKYGTERTSQAVRQAEKLDATIIGTGEELIKEYQQRGDFDLAIDMANDVSEKLTKAGQAIQAAKIYENLSPEAVLVRATKFVKKENQKVIKGGEFIAKKNELSPTDAEALYRIAEEMQNATGDLKTELAAEIGGILGKYKRVGIGKKISGIQTQMQLLNPKTLVTRNPLGNELFYRLERINKYVATPIDIVRSKLTGADRTVTFKTINQESFWKNWMKGAKAGWNRQTLGPNTQFDIAQFTFKNRLNPFYWGERALGAALKSFDYAAYKRGVGDTLGEMAYLKAMNEGYKGAALKKQAQQYLLKMDDKAHEIADQYGKYITFQDENVLSKGMIKVKSALNLQQDFGVGDLLIKYPKTPGALLMRALEYSPAGFIRSMYQIAMPVTSKATSREIVQSVSRAVVGTLGLTGLGYYLADKGMITGKRDDKATVRGLEEETGKGEYKINISAIKRWVLSGFTNTRISDKDILYTYDWAQPVSVALSIGANMNSEDPDLSGPAAAALSGVNTIIEQPLFSGLTNWLKYGDFVKGTQGVLEGLPASFTPTLANQFRQYVDNIRRQTKGASSTETAINRVLNRIPGQSEKLAPQIGVFGEAKKNFEKNNVFNIFFNPSNVTTFKESPEANLALSLLESTGETKQMPKVVDKDVTLFGQKYRMTNEEQAAMQQFVGKRSLIILGKAAESEKFATLSDEEKVNEISKLLTDLGSNVRLLLMAKKIQEAKNDGDKEALKLMAENVPQGKEAELRAAFEYLKTHDPFEIKLPENNGNNRGQSEEDKAKKKEGIDSAMKGTGGMLLAGLGLAAVSRGKNTKLLREAGEQFSKEATDVFTKASSKVLGEAEESLISLASKQAKTPKERTTVSFAKGILSLREGERTTVTVGNKEIKDVTAFTSKKNLYIMDEDEEFVKAQVGKLRKGDVVSNSKSDETDLFVVLHADKETKSALISKPGELLVDNEVEDVVKLLLKDDKTPKYLVSDSLKFSGVEKTKQSGYLFTHSTKLEEAEKILNTKKIIAPSIAITKKRLGEIPDAFGDYHFIFKEDSVLGKKDVFIYSGDAYTPRYVAEEKSLSKFLEDLKTSESLVSSETLDPGLSFIKKLSSKDDIDSAMASLISTERARKEMYKRVQKSKDDFVKILGIDFFRTASLNGFDGVYTYQVLSSEIAKNLEMKDDKLARLLSEKVLTKVQPEKVGKLKSSLQSTYNTVRVSYLEAKALKEMKIKEDVVGAIVPASAPKSFLDLLEKRGIVYEKYSSIVGEVTDSERKTSILSALSKLGGAGVMSIMYVPMQSLKQLQINLREQNTQDGDNLTKKLDELKTKRDQLKKENEELTARADELSKKKQQEQPQLDRITTPVIVEREGRKVDVNDINQLTELYKVRDGKYSGPKRTIGNIDLETIPYASNPGHVRSIKSIYSGVKDYDTKQMQAEFKRLGSPLQYITDQLEVALEHYGITPGEFIAVVRQDSGAGTSGWRAIENKNPGNVGNVDDGSNKKYDTWIEGSVAAIRNLAERKVK